MNKDQFIRRINAYSEYISAMSHESGLTQGHFDLNSTYVPLLAKDELISLHPRYFHKDLDITKE